MNDYIIFPYYTDFNYIIKLDDNKQWHLSQEDIRKNTIKRLLDFAVSPKTLAERMLEDSEEYRKWLDAQKPTSDSSNMRQSFN